MTNLNKQYRPTTFEEIEGQEQVTKVLPVLLKRERFPFVYLFHGPRGSGKTTTARVMHHFLNPPEMVDLFIDHDVPLNNKVEDAEGLTELARYAVEENCWRVVNLDEAHAFTPQAWDKLHKTFEEDNLARGRTLFVLSTTRLDKIPEAIQSRCSAGTFAFNRLPAPALRRRLESIAALEGIAVPNEAFQLLIDISDGDARKAIGALERLEVVLEVAPEYWHHVLGYENPIKIREFLRMLCKPETRFQACDVLIDIFTTIPAQRVLEQLHPYLLKLLEESSDHYFWTLMFDAYYKAVNSGTLADGVFLAMTKAAIVGAKND